MRARAQVRERLRIAALPRRDATLLFSRVLARSLRLGAITGAIAGAATAGALVGLGLRHGVALDPFLFAGRSAIGAAGPVLATIVGVLMHLAWMLVWGACFTVVAAPLRGARLALAALAFAAVVWTIATYALPEASPAVRFAGLTTAGTVFVYLVLAAALVPGMRLARLTLEG